MRVALCVLFVMGCGKSHKGDWEASRSHYCDEVDLFRHEADMSLETWAKRFDEIASKDAAEQPEWCADARGNLERLAATLNGFRRGAGALAMGRGDLGIEQAGLALAFGDEPIRTMLVEVHCTAGAPYAKYAESTRAARKASVEQLDAALAACGKIGWKSALQGSGK